MGQRLPSRFRQRGAAQELCLVQIVVEALAIRGDFSQTLSRLSLFLAGAVVAFRGTMGMDCSSDRMDKNIGKFQNLTCARHSLSCISVVDWTDTLSGPLMLLRPPRNMRLRRWLLVTCFSCVKNHNVLGPHLFANFTTHTKKISVPPQGRSYTEKKIPLW